MTRAPVQQMSFAAGLLDRSMRGRLDLKAYYAGVELADNVLPLPQGGMMRRPGLRWRAEISAAATGCRLARFEHSTDQAYLVAFTDLAARIYKDGVLQATVTMPYTAAQLAQLDWTQSLDTMILVHPDHAPQKLVRQGSHTAWALQTITLSNIPTHKFDGVTAEAVWSVTRGWPRSVCLHQGRLYFGGSRSQPQTIWGSKVNDFWNFAVSAEPLDDEAVDASLDGDQVNAITAVVSNGDLVILTTGTPWVADSTGGPITPSNFVPVQYAKVPAAAVRPVVIDGNVVFASATDAAGLVRQSVYELAWDDASQGYYAKDLALRCPELLQAPVDMAVRYGSEGAAAASLYVVQADGTLAVLTPNRFENLTAWSRWTTDGQVLRVAVVANRPLFLVKRTVAGVVRHFLEELDAGLATDCAVTVTAGAPATSWACAHLDGAEVRLVVDGHLQPPATVTGGAATSAEAGTSAEVGLTYGWSLRPMPLEAQLADGTLIGSRYRPLRIIVRVQDTAELWVDGRRQTFRKVGPALLDATLPVFSGEHEVRRLGWVSAYAPRLQGFDPLPATILSLMVEVAQ